ncbi:YdeI/OmpD-associated family protein [Marinoscillum pacificum]|uniref:YdeI/OmpD-associated family protein n=1 Tax=Marinoscillum pacificum TaxID=392723 RepID=UPI0021587B60|nr:DUF1801 domain-containing protein [Marinoscillum pacificum]
MKNPAIDNYLEEGCGRCKLGGTPDCKVHRWPKELVVLRQIVLDCGLTEELKWSIPCYTYEGANVCVVSAFKEYTSLSFFKGVLLQDAKALLHSQGENSQSARIIKITSLKQIEDLKEDLKAYVYEAIEVERLGLKVDFKQKDELEYPEELLEEFKKDPQFQTAFEALTPGRQRGFILNYTQPKQVQTRINRIQKSKPLVFAGKGPQGR